MLSARSFVLRAALAGLLTLPTLILGADKKPVTLEALANARPGPGRGGNGPAIWAPDGKTFVYVREGKLFHYDVAAKSSREIAAMAPLESAAVKPPDPLRFGWENRGVHESAIQWSPDGRSLLLISNGDLFLMAVDSGKFEQLTRTAAAERDPKFSPDGKRISFQRGHDLWVLDVASKKETQLTRDGSDTLRNAELDWVYPEELALGTAHWWSPDSKYIAYLQFDIGREPLYPHADVKGAKAIAEPERYPQAGDSNADVRLGVIGLEGNGATKWMDLGETRNSYLIGRVSWMPDSKQVAAIRLARVQNHLDLLACDIRNGAATKILEESDPYWVNLEDGVRFLKDGKSFLWTSERTGYRHIYRYSIDGKTVKALTSGDWEVRGIAGVDEDAGRVFYLSSEVSPLESHLYSIGLDGSGKTRLSKEPGSHSVAMNPAGTWYMDSYSSLNAPPRTVLRKGDGSDWTVYREADTSVADEYDLRPTEILSFKTQDGTLLYARMIKPAGFDPSKKYPAVVMVYGGPHGQAIHNSWPGGLSWDQLLAHKGFVIWQVDNRGTNGRGHAFEAAVYHKLGGQELADQREGVQYLLSLGFVDPARIGVYGWSYGGFMTLNCMLNAADMFQVGIAGAPVTDFANYDTIYTERYMGLPSENPDGYLGTRLPVKAGNLKGKLLLVHNTEDDNVLFQNTMQMMVALQRAQKPFELMLYSGKAHGVMGPDRRHLLMTTTEFFEKNLK